MFFKWIATFLVFQTAQAQIATSRPPWYWKPTKEPLSQYTSTPDTLSDRVDFLSSINWYDEVEKRRNQTLMNAYRPPPPPAPPVVNQDYYPSEPVLTHPPPSYENPPPEQTSPLEESECYRDVIHDQFQSRGYFFSWKDERSKQLHLNWPQAVQFCRSRCLELVSIDTPREQQFLASHITTGRIKEAWTSGRKCDFPGCEQQKEFQPADVYGWYWEGTRRQLAPTTNRFDTFWSQTGPSGKPQPDNYSGHRGGEWESCLAIFNNIYKDGVTWHDEVCSQRKPFICEEPFPYNKPKRDDDNQPGVTMVTPVKHFFSYFIQNVD